MTVRNVRKNLAAQQDLLRGIGPYNQTRRGQSVTVDGPAKSFIELWKAYCGPAYVGTFEDGCSISSAGAIVVSLTLGKAYRYSGTVPIVIQADTTVIGLDWTELTVSTETIISREALRRSYAKSGYNLVDGSFQGGFTLVSAKDVALDWVTGKAFSGAPGSYPAGTSTNGFLDVSDAIASPNEVQLKELGWKFNEDIATYINKAVDLGYSGIKLGKGVFLCSEVDFIGPKFSTFNIIGAGSGFAYAPKTELVPARSNQYYIFKSPTGAQGVDNVRFSKLKMSGQHTCNFGVQQLAGAGWEYEDLQLEGFAEWALWSQQGLNYYNRIYQRGVGNGKGIAVYSDYFCTNVETSGGLLGIRIMAGGGRLNNILSNSQTDCCIEISPLDVSTTHINTAMSNIYLGEVYNPLTKPHLRIKGNHVQRVRDVQISNINTVSAVAEPGVVKHNLHIEVEDAEVIINGWAARGIDAYETDDLYDEGALKATNSKVIVASGFIHGISRKPIEVVNSDVQIGSGVKFTDWGGAYAGGDNIAAVLCNDNTSLVTVADGVNFKNNRVSSWKAVKGISGTPFKIGRIVTNTPNPVEVVANPPAFEFTMPLDNTLYERGRRVSVHGTASTPDGGGSVFLYSFPSIPEDQSYEVTAQQVGNGDNAAVGRVFIGYEKSGVVTTGCTQTDTLAVSFSMSGAALVLTCGSGYTQTTWAFSIRRSM